MRRPDWLGRLVRRRRPRPDGLLGPGAFAHAALAERMRVDRNGSVLSLLLLELPEAPARPRMMIYFARTLAGRVRITDTVGVTRDRRLGVLLPDTPPEGAWRLAEDLRVLLLSAKVKPGLEVLVYPGPARSGRGPDDRRPGETGLPKDVGVPVGRPAGTAPAAVAGRHPSGDDGSGRVASAAAADMEKLLARPLPWWKRATDLLVGSVGLMLAAPVIGAAALAIGATSPGNPFFVQLREGLGGRRFYIFKLRTMYADAEQRRTALLSRSDQDGPAFKMRHDPRVTPLGRVLRMLSLDELPQLLNVLRGEMSLVGPRPLPVDESERCEAWQRQRLLVTPGITCTWQVHARNAVHFDEWVRMDLRYQRTRNLWGDLRLLLETGPSLLRLKGPR